MGFLIGLIVTVVGFILALAVHPTHPGSVNVNTVGWIMVVVGLIAFFADLVLWSSWGPGYMRRTYVDQRPGYGATSSRWGYPRRRVVEEEEGGGPRGLGPGY
jgi:protein-S-isoprenylcysteine O-methyltransferase Ste14